jgi:hypothetical protein
MPIEPVEPSIDNFFKKCTFIKFTVIAWLSSAKPSPKGVAIPFLEILKDVMRLFYKIAEPVPSLFKRLLRR